MRITKIGEAMDVVLRETEVPMAKNLSVYFIGLAKNAKTPVETWIGGYSRDITFALKQEFENANDEYRKCILVMLAENMEDPFYQAAADGLWEALRGIVHVLTAEKGARRIVLNLVRATPAEWESVRDAIVFLADSDSDFCAGETFDVREWK